MIEPRKFVSNYDDKSRKVNMSKPSIEIPNLDMSLEQDKDTFLGNIKKQLHSTSTPSQSVSKFVLLDDILYYVSEDESLDEVYLRLCIPQHLCDLVIKQYHDDMGHLGTDKCYSSIRIKYYWRNMYQGLATYIAKCITCNARTRKTDKTPVHETEIPNYPFRKICIDIHNLPTTLAGNRYLVGFIDVLSSWVEAFPVKHKTAENVAHLFLEEIFPRYGCPAEILTDSGTEFVNEILQHITKTLGIAHIRTSYYNPRANKIERWHRFIDDVISKTADDNNWDVYLNQCLAATRFAPSEGTKYSPYFLLYGRDVLLPLDNILQKRTRYVGEDSHKICLQRMHHAFSLAYRNLKHAQKRQAKYANKNANEVEFEVGQAVFLKNNKKKSKIDNRYLPYYRIIEKRGPISFVVKNILTGNVTKAHANNLKFANVEDWEIGDLERPSQEAKSNSRPKRKSTFVVPPSDPDTDSSSEESDKELRNDDVIKRFRFERTDSSSLSEDDIPLAELAKKYRRQKYSKSNVSTSSDSDTETDKDSRTNTHDQGQAEMLVDGIMNRQVSNSDKNNRSSKTRHGQGQNRKLKALLQAVTEML